MKPRLLGAVWVLVGLAIWNGFFDLYVSRGAREYLQLAAEAQLGRGPVPAMAEVMARARHDGILGSSIWAALVVVIAWITIWAVGRKRG